MDNTNFKVSTPPFETQSLRRGLTAFLDTQVLNPKTGEKVKVGNYKWGTYAFYDYDGEPIYVGQTNERLRTRIRRHLTNQRTDAVAMNVLDPFEVHTIRVWPLPQLEGRTGEDAEAKQILNSLERAVYDQALAESRFGAVLNEKDPPSVAGMVELPECFEASIVSKEVFEHRRHPDVRIARRAQVIARLAQVIEERKVNPGLRRVLVTQARRLEWLAEKRLEGVHG